MPYYDYKCKECDHTWEEQRTIGLRNVPVCNRCPECDTSESIILVIGRVTVGDPVQLGIRKPPAHFRDRLRQIEKNYSKPAGQSLKSRYAENIT